MNNIQALNILIIDDEKAILRLLKTILAKKKHNIDTAINGEEGLKKIRYNSYDFILTDIKMPGISGKEIVIEIKKITGDIIPVIGMSGTPWLLDDGLFDAVLIKPFTQQALFTTIKKVLSSF